MLVLYAPPFQTVEQDAQSTPEAAGFWRESDAIEQIDADEAVMIGDFGHGSDAVLAAHLSGPGRWSVIRLAWGEEGNHWVEVSLPSPMVQVLHVDYGAGEKCMSGAVPPMGRARTKGSGSGSGRRLPTVMPCRAGRRMPSKRSAAVGSTITPGRRGS